MLADNYIMYLRKSRADDPNESVEEVLSKHETILQNFSVSKFGERIPEKNIYREIVSGETIQDRPKIKEVLNLIENESILGVLVVEPQRLTRGDLIDCGTIINAFKYSSTLIITPTKTFDLSLSKDGINYDEKILKMELSNGSEYLDYTKMIMNRGRLLSIEKGNYICSIPPYGYDKIIVDKSPTLKINDTEAEAVKLIYNLYLEGCGYVKIATQLNNLGYKPRKTEHWSSSVIKDILQNETYTGKVIWNHRKEIKTIKNGKMTKVRPRQKDYIIRDGKHPSIISEETFHKVQERIGNNPRVKKNNKMINPLSSILFCKKCGRAIIYRTYKKNGNVKSNPRYLCSNQSICHTKSILADELINNLITSLEQMIVDFEFKVKSNNKAYIDIYEQRIVNLQKELDRIEEKQNELYDLLESKIYTRDVFIKRNDKLSIERKKAQKELRKAQENAPEKINYKDKIVKFKNVIELLRDDDVETETKNYALKEIIERIDYDMIDDKVKLIITLK